MLLRSFKIEFIITYFKLCVDKALLYNFFLVFNKKRIIYILCRFYYFSLLFSIRCHVDVECRIYSCHISMHRVKPRGLSLGLFSFGFSVMTFCMIHMLLHMPHMSCPFSSFNTKELAKIW